MEPVRAWRFHRGPCVGAEQPFFDDAGWREVDLPHDWSIEPVPGTGSAFSETGSGGGRAMGHSVGGEGWYRTTVKVEPGRRAELIFDGVYMNADVYVDGRHAAFHPYGYTAFAVDLTPHLTPGRDPLVAVRVRNEGHTARWYSGSGLYRSVVLRQTGDAHVVWDGLRVVAESGTVEVHAEIVGQGSASLSVYDTAGICVARADGPPPWKVTVPDPQLWFPCDLGGQPLYRAEVEVRVDGVRTDMRSTTFGIRRIEVDAAQGLRVNGVPCLLKGGCVHHDHGILGARAFAEAEERRVRLLVSAGYNAVRTSHNPPSTAFLEACDRHGVLVLDEVHDEWERAKCKDGYVNSFPRYAEADARAMVRRDRNHPCVWAWSIGNEIPGCFTRPDLALRLRQAVLSEDPTRPVSAGICGPWWKEEGWVEWETSSDVAFESLDIGGYNYLPAKYETDHERHPDRVIMGTESFPLQAWESWEPVVRLPHVIGDFVWTALDYIGESGIGHRFQGPGEPLDGRFPYHLGTCGDIDLIGWRKPQSYYRESLWREGVVRIAVHQPACLGRKQITEGWGWNWGWDDVASHWNWPVAVGEPLTVEVYSSEPWVDLSLNGRALGRWVPEKNRVRIEVPFEPGVLEAKGPQGTHRLATADEPASLATSVERIGELAFVTFEVVDGRGTWVPDANVRVEVQVEDGELLALGNADPTDVEDVTDADHRAWQGRLLAVVRCGPAARLTWSAEGATGDLNLNG